MDIPNAFVGHKEQPAEADVLSSLGPSAGAWQEFVASLANDHGVTGQKWKSISPKYDWSLRLSIKKRNIVHLAPCSGCFRVAFILGDRAAKAALQGSLPKSITMRFVAQDAMPKALEFDSL